MSSLLMEIAHSCASSACLPEDAALLARTRRALSSCRSAEARIVAAEARLLHLARETRVYEALGYPTLSCFAREELKIDGRTARDRVALHGVMEQWPALGQAFVAGRVSAGHLLALRSVLDRAQVAPDGVGCGVPPSERPGAETERWIALAERLSLREFRRCVREARSDDQDVGSGVPGDDEDDAERTLVTFEAPLVAARAWEAGVNTARRVLGKTASVAECVEAILVEAAPDACAGAWPDEAVIRGADDRPVPREEVSLQTAPGADTGGPVRITNRWKVRLEASLIEMESRLRGIGVAARMSAESPREWLRQFLSLRQVRSQLETGLHRLLADLRDSGLIDGLGYARLSDLVESELGYSPRGARHLVAVLNLMHASPALAEAGARGAIGTVHAFLIARHVDELSRARWARRAEAVSVRQLERELSFVERCSALDRAFGALVRAAWPDPGRLGWLAAELARRSGAESGSAACAANVFHLSADPAAHPDVMRRLESLLDRWETANHELEMNRLEKTPLTRVIRFRLPRAMARAWWNAVRTFAPLPPWAAAVLLVDRATAVWVARHRESPPVEDRILERDDYRCQTPGCGARSGLEVHHIVPRARGGPNTAWNRITLCHWHHHRGIHEGRIRLKGSAPDRLRWEMPLARWEGELRVTPV